MFQMIVSGKISNLSNDKKMLGNDFCASFHLTESYYDREAKTRVYEVWVPTSLKARVERLCQNGKYIGVRVSDYAIQMNFDSEPAMVYMQLKVADLFIL